MTKYVYYAATTLTGHLADDANSPTFVFTSRELAVPQGADVRLVSGDVASSLPKIVEAAGDRDVWIVGGGDLAGQFYDTGALDEVQLTGRTRGCRTTRPVRSAC